jgi:hypothetical protein
VRYDESDRAEKPANSPTRQHDAIASPDKMIPSIEAPKNAAFCKNQHGVLFQFKRIYGSQNQQRLRLELSNYSKKRNFIVAPDGAAIGMTSPTLSPAPPY